MRGWAGGRSGWGRCRSRPSTESRSRHGTSDDARWTYRNGHDDLQRVAIAIGRRLGQCGAHSAGELWCIVAGRGRLPWLLGRLGRRSGWCLRAGVVGGGGVGSVEDVLGNGTSCGATQEIQRPEDELEGPVVGVALADGA